MRNVIIWHWFIKNLVGTWRRNDVDATSLRGIDVSTTSCACWEFGPPNILSLGPQYPKPSYAYEYLCNLKPGPDPGLRLSEVPRNTQRTFLTSLVFVCGTAPPCLCPNTTYLGTSLSLPRKLSADIVPHKNRNSFFHNTICAEDLPKCVTSSW